MSALLDRTSARLLRMAKTGFRRIFPRRDYLVFRGSRLPLPGSRLNREDQRDNAFFLDSSIAEARRIVEHLGGHAGSFVLDIGCGQGRLPIGLVPEFRTLRYLGLDVSEESIRWCTTHLQARYPSYRFQHIDVVNARYNPSGSALDERFRLPVGDAEADIVYMWGVVTNMEPEHLAPYAHEIGRVLRPGGTLFLTANIESDVATVSINPEDYTAFGCDGPLHIVRYERDYFLAPFRDAGLTLTRLEHHAAGNCQSDLYFVKTP